MERNPLVLTGDNYKEKVHNNNSSFNLFIIFEYFQNILGKLPALTETKTKFY